MQKKAKSRLTEFLFVSICLIGAAASIWKFSQILNESLVKDEEPIANITFKWKVAQRQFLDDLLWDRLQQMSPVYNGDTIRTAPASEATIYFTDGNIIQLTTNSMIQIFLKEDKRGNAELKKGSASVIANNSDFTLQSGDASIEIEKGSTLQTETTSDGSLKMQVVDGKIQIQNPNGTFTVLTGETAFLSTDGIISQSHLNVQTPTINAQYLNFREENTLVDFEWTTESNSILLETAADKKFNDILSSQIIRNAKRASMAVPSGTIYWRISTIPEGDITYSESVSGKIKVIYSPAPDLITPVQDFQTKYRTKQPSIRFTWTEVERASSYQIDIADNVDFINPVFSKRTPQTSIVSSDLGKGTWYWRVTPYYMINNIGLAEPSITNSFVINQTEMLEKPELKLPGENAFVGTRISSSNNTSTPKTIYFSWLNDIEAETYNFKLWKKSNPSRVLQYTKINQNYFSIDTSTVDIENGDWLWEVEKVDSEGNTVTSDPRSFYAMDTEVDQRSLFPPDGYSVPDTRTQDLRYNWKTNITTGTTFQIAKDANFKKIVYSETTYSNSANGRTLPKGTYFWRITSTLGDLTFSTNPKKLTVEPPLAAPTPAIPANGGSVVVRPTKPYEFKWNTVPGADYYEIKIARASNPSVTLIDKNFIVSNNGSTASVKLNFDRYSEGNYIFTLQAFKEETELSARASGYIGTYAFVLKQLKPVQLLAPDNDSIIDGATAIKNPPYMNWTIVDTPAKLQLVIYKKEESNKKKNPDDYSIENQQPFIVIDNPTAPYRLPPIYEGSYLWKINAYTSDNYDISSLETRDLKITAIPKLEAPAMNEPKKNTTFGKDYFVANKSISFKWGRVKNADQYIFTIRNTKNEVLLTKTLSKNTTEFVLTAQELSLLPKGKLTWEVEGQSLYQGTLFQNGKTTPATFKIDLPELKSPKFEQTGTMYGK